MSYIFIFSIPFILLLFIINNLYIKNIKDELSITNQNLLNQSNSILNEQLVDTRALADYIDEEDTFKPSSVNDSYNNFKKEIKQYETTNIAVKSLYVALDNGSKVLSSNGFATLDALFLSHPLFSRLEEADKMRSFILGDEQNIFAIDDHLFYTMPLTTSKNRGNILIEINAQEIKENIQILNRQNDGTSFLVTDDAEILFMDEKDSSISKNGVSNSLEEILTEEKVRIKKNSYLAQKTKNKLTDWSFVVVTNEHSFYQPLYRVIFVSVIAIIMMVILGIILSYYFAKKNYQPLKRLLENIKKDQDYGANEWEFLEKNLMKTYSEVENLNLLIDEQTPIVRNSILLDLVKGNYSNYEYLKNQFNEEEIDFPFNYYSFAILSFDEEEIGIEGVLQLQQIRRDLNIALEEKGYSLELAMPYLKMNQIFLIINLKDKSKKSWNYVIKKIREEFKKMINSDTSTLRLAIGSTFQKIEEINRGYIEASTALETMDEKTIEQSNVLFFEELNLEINKKNLDTTIKYPEKSVLLLLQSLKQANSSVAQEMLDEIFVEIKEKSRETIINQAIIAFLFNSILQLSNELGLKDYSYYLLRINSFEEINRAKELLAEMIEDICQELEKEIENRDELLDEEIKNYLYDHFDSNDISLDQIASKYDISISYASKLIKEETGATFSIIIQDLRMEKFKKLLIETSEPIKKLVKEIGYLDVSNFTRKFRKENKMTPGQYRKKYR